MKESISNKTHRLTNGISWSWQHPHIDHRYMVLGAWLCSDIVSLFGSTLSSLAVPWMVLNLTHNTVATGIVSAVQLGMLVVANLLCGPLIDKLGPTRISVTCDCISAAFIALVPVMWFAHLFSIPLLIGVVAVVGTMRGPSNNAKDILSPSIAAFSKQAMERITGLASTTSHLAGTIGSALGGVIVGLIGGPYALAFTSLALLCGAGMIGFIVRPALLADSSIVASLKKTAQADETDDASSAMQSRHMKSPDQPANSRAEQTHSMTLPHQLGLHIRAYIRNIGDGWKVLIAVPVLLGYALIPAVTNMLDVAWTDVLAPAWVLNQHHGSASLGLLFASLSLPALVGSTIATIIAERLPRFPVMVIGYLLVGFPRYLVMALNAPMPVILTVIAIGGFGSGFLNPIFGAVMYERIPVKARGKVISLTSAMIWGLMPLGSLIGGFSSHLLGLNLTLAILGSTYLVMTLLPVFIPALHHIERPERGALVADIAEDAQTATAEVADSRVTNNSVTNNIGTDES
ncbi:MFS transporter [Bifidobacterium aquikefiricola]|uniref:MFS transporter n=1 Tax=Bifidobacterium aquikefiricola TaxID=3059038 RepID=A0AB39U5H3_9BIFI